MQCWLGASVSQWEGFVSVVYKIVRSTTTSSFVCFRRIGWLMFFFTIRFGFYDLRRMNGFYGFVRTWGWHSQSRKVISGLRRLCLPEGDRCHRWKKNCICPIISNISIIILSCPSRPTQFYWLMWHFCYTGIMHLFFQHSIYIIYRPT